MTAWRQYGRTVAQLSFLCADAVAFLYGSPASAAWVGINPPNGAVILRINFTGRPTVTFNVPAAQVGNGTPIVGTPVLEFEMSVQRATGGGAPNLTATMRATAPTALFSGANQIPISDISWTSVAITGAPAGTTLIPNGSFVGGAQTIVSITTTSTTNFYAGGALTFRYANATVYPQGTYGPATVNYTASRNP
jgi:hypothetical protein